MSNDSFSNTPPLIAGCEPPRPKRNDPAILRLAAKELAEQVVDWASQDEEPSENDRAAIENDLFEVLSDSYEYDGFELAEKLKSRFYYDADSGLVEAMDKAFHVIHKHHKAAEKKWVADNNIQPKFAIGDKVVIKRKWQKDVEGTIYDIKADEGVYYVNCPSLGHQPIGSTQIGKAMGIIADYEQCHPLTAAAPETPKA